MPRRPQAPKSVETLTHDEATRANLPSAEHQPLMDDAERAPIIVEYRRRDTDLDPQLVWRGKAEPNADGEPETIAVSAPPLYIQERVHPKALVDDLIRETAERNADRNPAEQPDFADLFADFNGLPSEDAKTEFYQHPANWTNRLILGDSLQVMASLAERESLRGQVQCVYIDPPYGIRFNSNFQWSTTNRDVSDGNPKHITREPEQVKAFRDTWRDGVHSYLSYLRDRLTAARELLAESGSVFVQIGDENVHRVRALMDEVFGDENFVNEIKFRTTSNRTAEFLPSIFDTILHYAKDRNQCKFRHTHLPKDYSDVSEDSYGCIETDGYEWRRLSRPEKDNPRETERKGRLFGLGDLTSSHKYIQDPFVYNGKTFDPKDRYWSTSLDGLNRIGRANRLCAVRETLRYKRYFHDTPVQPLTNIWADTGSGSRTERRTYVVQTMSRVIQRCILMTTDPGDLVLDPTCGSGTTAYVAEQWGRRWVAIDTSRVALALARIRIMGARYPYYLLADSAEGQAKLAELDGRDADAGAPAYGHLRQGFVYRRVPHITLRDIANNAEIDVIWESHEARLAPLREALSRALGESERLEEWRIPPEPADDWSDEAASLLAQFRKLRLARQREMDAAIARRAEYEYLYDQPYEDRRRVRVAGPFTVESVSPHRTLAVDEDGEFVEPQVAERDGDGRMADFADVIIDNLKTAGVQQAHREDRIEFSSLVPWPGEYVCAEGVFAAGEGGERRAGLFIGPEFGSVSRSDLAAAAREAAESGFDVLIACAFNYEAQTAEMERLGRIRVLKARMNADLHMADSLKNTGSGNLFVIFGEPDIEARESEDGMMTVRVNGVDVFDPTRGEVRSDDADGIACWFIDTDYNEESFFARHAYFLGAGDPYKSLKTTLKAEVDKEAWDTLNSAVSRPFPKPRSGRIAVKAINHLGDEVMKVFRVG